MKSVYLAGPIAGCDGCEANTWRAVMAAAIQMHGISGISPLRCEPLIGARYEVGYEDPKFGTARAIASKNFLDVQMCDMTLCYMPAALVERRMSYGTLVELAWAHALRKPTILVTDFAPLVEHPVVQACASWTLTTLNDACEVIIGVLGDHAK